MPLGFMTKLPSTQNAAAAPCIVPNYTPSTGALAQSRQKQETMTANIDCSNEGSEAAPRNDSTTAESDSRHSATEGELPSVGSAGHADGSCKRCAFFPKGRCKNGSDCTHCHFDHAPRARIRKSAATKVRSLEKALQEPTLTPSTEDECSKDDPMEAETTANSSSAASDVEEGATVHSSDSEKASEDRPRSESSDSEILGLPPYTPPHDATDKKTYSDPSSLTLKPRWKDLKMETSPSSWAAQQRTRKLGCVSKDLSAADIGRMIRALLNKLTEDKFESLAAQILALPFSTTEQLGVLAAEIFEKATAQDGFRSLYTELCMRINTHLADQSSVIGGKAFRVALVNECQATFERNLQPVDASVFAGLNEEEHLEAELKLKIIRLGNMRFIGELLVRKLLAPKLLPPIVQQLLNGDEAMLESLIALLTIVGPVLENAGTAMSQAALKDAFTTLRRKVASKDKTVSLRLRCLITDLLEARAQGWTLKST